MNKILYIATALAILIYYYVMWWIAFKNMRKGDDWNIKTLAVMHFLFLFVFLLLVFIFNQ